VALRIGDVTLDGRCDGYGSGRNRVADDHGTVCMTVSPNPSSDRISVLLQSSTSSIAIVSIDIVNLDGQVLVSTQPKASGEAVQVNVVEFTNGLYIVKVKDAHGKIYQSKFLKIQ
jgi:Secretion system C-terminal sorting domain